MTSFRHLPVTRSILVILIFLACKTSSLAQCNPLVFDSLLHTVAIVPTMQLNLVSDFCAVGDGQANDYDAFARARNFIGARGGHCTLYIPGGTYKINAQVPNNMTLGGGGGFGI